MHPLTNAQLAADRQAGCREAAARHRLARQYRRSAAPDRIPGLRAALGRGLITLGLRLVERSAARSRRGTWAAG